MGRLAGFNHQKVTKKLQRLGFEFARQSKGSHEVWYNSVTNRCTMLPHHSRDIPEGTLREILKQAQITPNQFINA